MKIAIDLSVLQTDHRFRGIGSVVVNFINNLSENVRNNNTFVFFVEQKKEKLAYNLLKLDNINYEIRYLNTRIYFQFPGKLNLIAKAFHKFVGLMEYYYGDPRISKDQLSDIDKYIQFDQNRKLPRNSKSNTILFIHDIIPYVIEYDYLPSYKTARLNGRSVKGSIKAALLRHQYIWRIKINCNRAHSIIANSKHTKEDFIKYLNVNKDKIKVAHLGINKNQPIELNEKIEFNEYKTTIWGPVKNKIGLTKKPFLLFMGGTDPRRKMIELIAAYNNLRARGVDISLVLAGDAMDGLDNLKSKTMKKYLSQNISYADDIHLMGYVSNTEKAWLYKNALVFVFPSVYEGFGLPVLEAMNNGSPVITFNNTSISEVGGDSVIYVKNFLDIVYEVQRLIDSPKEVQELSQKAKARASKFTWSKMSNKIISIISQ